MFNCGRSISTTITSVICWWRPTPLSISSSTACFDVSSAGVCTPAAVPRSSPKDGPLPFPLNSTHSTLQPPLLLPVTPTSFRSTRREQRCWSRSQLWSAAVTKRQWKRVLSIRQRWTLDLVTATFLIPTPKYKVQDLLSYLHTGRRTFPVLRSTCSWRVTIYVRKPSAIGQSTRPT